MLDNVAIQELIMCILKVKKSEKSESEVFILVDLFDYSEE